MPLSSVIPEQDEVNHLPEYKINITLCFGIDF